MKLELQLSSTLQEALSARAQAHSRSVEDEARQLLKTALEPLDFASERDQLTVLDDATLWQLASQTVSLDKSEQMQGLSEQQKTIGLAPEASGELERLRKYAERVMLFRAEAAALLKRRGHDVGRLLAQL